MFALPIKIRIPINTITVASLRAKLKSHVVLSLDAGNKVLRRTDLVVLV